MTLNRRAVTVGLATLGLVGLAGGGVAWAATDAGSPPATASSTATSCGEAYGMGYGKYAPMTAVAGYLGLSRTELVTQMHAGKTLAEIAEKQGKTVSGLEAAMVAAMQRSLAADEALTPAQRTAILALMSSHLDAMVTGTRMPGTDLDGTDLDDMGTGMTVGSGFGMMGGSGGGMMGH